jgi:hypothetical protein
MHTIKYANAYLTDRLYGGPEEGGWYYDAGEPVMSLPFVCYDESDVDENGEWFISKYDNLNRNLAFEAVHALCEAAGDICPPEKEYLQKRDWVLDGFAIYIEDKPGEYFPQKRPHWDMGEDY